MAGYTLTAAALNDRAGALANTLWQSLEQVRQFKLWLDDSTHTDTLIGPSSTVGVSSADLTLIRTSFADLGGTTGLYAVAHGTYAPPGANNYFFTAKQLTGLYYAG
jgi:hypothetical protein